MTLTRILALLLLFPALASAQVGAVGQLVRLTSGYATGTLAATGDSVILDTTFQASLRIDIVGSFSGTVSATCSLDNGTTYRQIAINGPMPASTEDSDGAVTTGGAYTASVAGCQKVKVAASSWVSGTPIVYMRSTASGGSSGGSAGGGGAVTNAGTFAVQVTQGGNTAAVNASSQLSVTCANCSGSGVSVNEDVASADGQAGTPAYTVRNGTLTGATSTDGDYQPMKSTNAGAIYTAPTYADVVASTGTGASGAQTPRVVTATDSTIGTVTTVSTLTTLSQFGGNAVNLGAGTTGTGTLRVTLPTDGTGVLGSIGSITSAVVPGTAATNLGKAIDNAVGATDTGVAALFQRFDSPTTLTPATGDYAVPRLDSLGRTWVNCATGCSGAGVTDNAAFTTGSGTINAIGGILDDTGSAVATENSAAIARITANKAIHVNLRNASGAELTPSVDVTEDAAETPGGTGPMIMSVRRDVQASSAGTTGDNATVNTDSLGGLWIAGNSLEDSAETANTPLLMAGAVRRDVLASSSGTTGDNSTINTTATGAVWVAEPDPCSSGTKVFVNINQTTGTQLFTGTASNRTYVCAVHLITATAQNIALVSGTGTVCATGISGMMGGSTAATGWNLAANGGLVIVGGNSSVAKSAVNADNVCLLQSSSGQISGNIVYVVAP